jgi:hypothetical protein
VRGPTRFWDSMFFGTSWTLVWSLHNTIIENECDKNYTTLSMNWWDNPHMCGGKKKGWHAFLPPTMTFVITMCTTIFRKSHRRVVVME